MQFAHLILLHVLHSITVEKLSKQNSPLTWFGMISQIFCSCTGEGKQSIYFYQRKWNYNKEIKALEELFQLPDRLSLGAKNKHNNPKQTVLPISIRSWKSELVNKLLTETSSAHLTLNSVGKEDANCQSCLGGNGGTVGQLLFGWKETGRFLIQTHLI